MKRMIRQEGRIGRKEERKEGRSKERNKEKKDRVLVCENEIEKQKHYVYVCVSSVVYVCVCRD